MQTEDLKKRDPGQVKVCIRLRPLFSSEKQAAKWTVDSNNHSIKVKNIL